MKSDEKQFMKEVLKNETLSTAKKRSIRQIIEELPINKKRANYILEKWTSNGWYDWGVSIDMGWIEKDKYKEMEMLINGYRANH